MHILLLNEYYPPDTSATAKVAAQIAETLAQRHKVTVVAGRPSYDPDEFYPWALLRSDLCNGVHVERVGSTAYSRHQMRRRVSNYFSYLALAVPRVLAIKADIVLAMTDPPVAGIAGSFVARITRCPFVYSICDLYPEMAVVGNIMKPSIWTHRWEKMHRHALKQAARVIVLGDDMRERIVAKGVAPQRVTVVRSGSSLPSAVPDLRDPNVLKIVNEIRCGFPFVVLHAGNLGFYGAWDTLLGAAELLRNENVGFVFVGDGANRAALGASASNSSNVRFLPFRPAEQIPHVMMAGDVQIVTIRRGLEGVVVPSKLYSTLAMGRPVLAVAPPSSDAARIVVESGCGIAADPDDPVAVVAAIRELRSDPARLALMGRRAREAAGKYARLKELERFSEIVDQVGLEGGIPHRKDVRPHA
ncbi:MAG TPA: glycosyltransferase family 4 protein [Candidatus Acidoferrales bacterium]